MSAILSILAIIFGVSAMGIAVFVLLMKAWDNLDL